MIELSLRVNLKECYMSKSQITHGCMGKRPMQEKWFACWNTEWSKQQASINHKDSDYQEDIQKDCKTDRMLACQDDLAQVLGLLEFIK
ncbi:hypothetical protein M0802_015307 [Mischocyttarus mexicanus]|nr:hypothetical protein M0802_015307 [Mischocyttarus mexicanus]